MKKALMKSQALSHCGAASREEPRYLRAAASSFRKQMESQSEKERSLWNNCYGKCTPG